MQARTIASLIFFKDANRVHKSAAAYTGAFILPQLVSNCLVPRRAQLALRTTIGEIGFRKASEQTDVIVRIRSIPDWHKSDRRDAGFPKWVAVKRTFIYGSRFARRDRPATRTHPGVRLDFP